MDYMNLMPNTYNLSVTAVDEEGNESEHSNIVIVTMEESCAPWQPGDGPPHKPGHPNK